MLLRAHAGTAAYVAAGKYGKQLLEGGGALEGPHWWQASAGPLLWAPTCRLLVAAGQGRATNSSLDHCQHWAAHHMCHACPTSPPINTPLLGLQVGLALGVTALAVGYIGRLASKAMAEVSAELEPGEADKTH